MSLMEIHHSNIIIRSAYILTGEYQIISAVAQYTCMMTTVFGKTWSLPTPHYCRSGVVSVVYSMPSIICCGKRIRTKQSHVVCGYYLPAGSFILVFLGKCRLAYTRTGKLGIKAAASVPYFHHSLADSTQTTNNNGFYQDGKSLFFCILHFVIGNYVLPANIYSCYYVDRSVGFLGRLGGSSQCRSSLFRHRWWRSWW